MNNEYLNVDDLKHFTTLTNRQIRNNINRLRKSNKFNGYIKGGGRGKGGQFWFHFSIIPYITNRIRMRRNVNSTTTYSSRKLSEFIFSRTKWNYFGCIKPNEEIDIFDLIGSLSPFFSFYCVHRNKEKNHIHFSVKTSLQIEDFKELLKLYFKKINKSIDRVFLTHFDTELGGKTLNYLLRRGNHNTKRDLIDWGLITPDTL
jgi:hypothetical protein